MVVISDELITFKDKIGDSISSMKTCTSTIKSKLDELSNTVISTSSSVSNVYNSSNKSALLAKFDNIKDIIKIIGDSVQDTLEVKLTNCSNLLDEINELENKKTLIDSAYNDMQSDPSKSYKYNSLTSGFSVLLNKANSTLTELKSNDEEISFASEFQINDLSAISENLKFGSYERYSFTSSSNYQIDYYLYTPDYGEPISGLPTMVYLAGAGERGNNINNRGLPSLIDQQQLTPGGIVLVPQFSGEPEMDTAAYQNALIELIDHVVEQNNGDKNKVSLCGHSLGAILGYKIVADNPDRFSAFIPISGKSYKVVDKQGNILADALEALNKIKILSLCGTTDRAWGNFPTSKKLAEDLKQTNSDVYFVPLEGEGHNIQTKVFLNNFQLENGQTVNVLDWAFNQSRA